MGDSIIRFWTVLCRRNFNENRNEFNNGRCIFNWAFLLGVPIIQTLEAIKNERTTNTNLGKKYG